jgi:sulfur carrier protein
VRIDASMNAPITITVALDGKPHQIPAGTTLAALVAGLGHAPNAVATAVNGRFVARGLREGLQLQADDAVLLFQPIAGG